MPRSCRGARRRGPYRRLWGRLAPLALLVLASACTPPPTPFEAPGEEVRVAERTDAARLGPGDIFELRVFGEEELSGAHRVSPQGTILVPLIGTVEVVGLTPPDVAEAVTERLRDGYLRDPHVTVFVKEYTSKRFSILGSVRKPGWFPYIENMTIVDAVALAGGITDLGNSDGTVVTRVVDGEEKRYVVPVGSISRGEASNFVLHPGDIVFVPERIL